MAQKSNLQIFAFMVVEGSFHTHNLRQYLLRLLIWAILTEIPFDLMYGGSVFYLYHQNVIWTFLLSLLIISLIEKCKTRFHTFPTVLISAGLALLALIPIWLYQGKQGHHSKTFQYFCYAFYPVHMLPLFVVRELWLL